jgi:integrase
MRDKARADPAALRRDRPPRLTSTRSETRRNDRTIGIAVDAYLDHLRSQGRRLHGLLRVAERDRHLPLLTPRLARELLARRRSEVAIDTQIGELATARTFASWCVDQGWLPSDPFDGLEVTGTRARGKAQLRIDEARRFVETALSEGDERGLTAAMALLMGLRASEITNRVVRDVDDGARVLWIERAKTRAGDQRLEVPEVLQPRLAALISGRDPDAPLFGDHDRHWVGYHARRLCRLAKVPVV